MNQGGVSGLVRIRLNVKGSHQIQEVTVSNVYVSRQTLLV